MRNLFTNRISKYLHFINDSVIVDEQKALDEIKINNQFSLSYILLLVTSSVIATLGLLQNSGPIIIGGMIISPLMWPLLNISSSIAHDRKSNLRKGISLLTISFFVSLLTSFIITKISPLNSLTEEILSRTNPILPDILVALAGGLVASYGLLHSRISQSLAGVAIATSLMPPLCVVGIGLALSQLNISSGALILFLTNCVAIVFISIIVFFIQNYNKKDIPNLVKKSSFIFVTLTMIGLAIPLYVFMQDYIYNQNISSKVSSVLVSSLNRGTNSVQVKNLRLFEPDNDSLIISADLISSGNIDLTFSDEFKIKNDIQGVLDKSYNIQLQLTNQNTLKVLTEDELKIQREINTIKNATALAITSFNDSFVVNKIEVDQKNLNINATIYINPQSNINYSDLKTINNQIDIITGEKTNLQLTILPLVVINEVDETQSEIEKSIDKAKNEISQYLNSVSDQIDINIIEINKDLTEIDLKEKLKNEEDINEAKIFNASIRITKPQNIEIDGLKIKNIISDNLDKNDTINLTITTILKQTQTI